ncbi:MAG: PduL/EutD family phosphate acyltransferase [Patescibacteria group bacterium]|jgi:putative phosphotransacetylase
MQTTIEVSARHIHLTAEDFEKLFGKSEMSIRNNLSQKGEFASNETLEVVGPKSRIVKVRVLGPFREKSQLEISRTDSVSLGIDAPYLESGDGNGARIRIIGSKGEIIDNIAIVAMRHIHLSPLNAQKAGVSDGDFVSVKISGERQTTLGKIIVRIEDNFLNHVHLDTDDANACGIVSGFQTEIIK